MKKCVNENCNNQIEDKYKFCTNCLQNWKSKNINSTEKTPITNVGGYQEKEERKVIVKQWNEDPIIDQLMKINSNLATIKQLLQANMPK